jgi:outer membrane receptor for ferrienterochelin and colicins
MFKRLFLVMLTAILILIVSVSGAAAEEIMELKQLVVTANRYQEDSFDLPINIEIIDEEQIAKSQANNLGDLLKNSAGIQIKDNGGPGGQKTIHLRGSSASQVLILLDGQKINSSQNGEFDLAQILLSNVKKVEIIKGPASAVYGANALGGVVNIITKTAADLQKSELVLGMGSANTYQTSFNYGTRLNKGDIVFSFGSLNSAGFRDDTDHDELDRYFLSTKINRSLTPNTKLLFALNYHDSQKDIPGTISTPTPEAEQETKRNTYQLKLLNQLAHKDTELVIYYKDQNQIYDEDTTISGESDHKTKELSYNLNQIQYFARNTLSYGVEYNKDKIDSSDNGKHDFVTKSVYLNDKIKLAERITVNAGLRYDDHEKFGSATSPRIGLVYKLNRHNNLFFSYGEAYRTPTFNDLYWPKTKYSEGNSDLEAEESKSYEIGYKSNYNSFGLNLSFFRRESDNLIDWAAQDDKIWRPSNVDEAQADGIELNLSKSLTDKFKLEYQHTYLDSRDKNTDRLLEDQNYNNLILIYQPANYSINFKISHVSGRVDDLDNYTICNLNIIKQIQLFNNNYKFKISIDNLFDRDYQINNGYPMPGRNFMFNLSTTF